MYQIIIIKAPDK